MAVASSFLPSRMSRPICFEILLTSARLASSSVCAFFLCSLWAAALSIIAAAFLKCFFSSPLIVSSLWSVICFIVSMFFLFFCFLFDYGAIEVVVVA